MMENVTKTIQLVEDAEQFFLAYAPPGMKGKYTLGRMQEFMRRLGNPQDTMQVIHVAGTSGKTSTSYFIRALLEQAGKKTGLTVSPHMETIAERAQVKGSVLPEDVYMQYFTEFRKKVQQNADLPLTYFELVTAFAYWVFAREKVDYAIIETGLGGLLDATNIVSNSNKICVITPIGYDHTEILGDTLEKIAEQKAGIIQQHNRVFLSADITAVKKMFLQRAAEKDAEVRTQTAYPVPPFLPRFQSGNWQLARTVVDFVYQSDGIATLSNEQLSAAAKFTPPGRFETYKVAGKILILDGAHNPQKIEALLSSLSETMKHDITILFSLREAVDTKIQACVQKITELDVPVICTAFFVGQDLKNIHSVDAKQLCDLFIVKGANARYQSDPAAALEMLIKSPGDVKLVTGSLYLVSLVRKLLANNYGSYTGNSNRQN